MLSLADRLLSSADQALRAVAAAPHAARPNPGWSTPAANLSNADRRLSGSLMRVNHVGEICAQALYEAQALTAQDPALREHFEHAARDESDHLAWVSARLRELDARPSLLNPLWYSGAFLIGLAAGRLGERASLGFVVETERQVEQHLAGHLERLPADDSASRAIVEQMKADEARHADDALAAGAASMPSPVRWLMRAAARVMTTTAHYV